MYHWAVVKLGERLHSESVLSMAASPPWLVHEYGKVTMSPALLSKATGPPVWSKVGGCCQLLWSMDFHRLVSSTANSLPVLNMESVQPAENFQSLAPSWGWSAETLESDSSYLVCGFPAHRYHKDFHPSWWVLHSAILGSSWLGWRWVCIGTVEVCLYRMFDALVSYEDCGYGMSSKDSACSVMLNSYLSSPRCAPYLLRSIHVHCPYGMTPCRCDSQGP